MSDRKTRVLYVDDEELNLMIFKIHFEPHFEVLTTESGEDALDLIAKNSDTLDVVVSDMRMPGMSGVELIRKAHQEHRDILYYILSGFNYDKEIEAAVEENIVQKFFNKPFNADEIKAAINQAMNGNGSV